jgi:diadenosine tetraphosphate (Ap4A) HIT family hydrolase
MTCEYCTSVGGDLIWRDALCRVVLAPEAGFPGFCRVIWQAHVREMTDLPEAQRAAFMRVVFAVEAALRETLNPLKINLASLGNLTPHLHWHVVPRYADDSHFPSPIWANSQRPAPQRDWPTDWTARLGLTLEKRLA